MKIKTIITILSLIFFYTQSVYSQNVEDQFQLGKRYFDAKDYTKAKNKFSFVVSKNDLYYEAYTYRARCYLELNQPDSALVDFATALKKKNDYLPAYYYRANYYFQQKNNSKAVHDLNFVIENKPNFMPAVLLRAEIYELEGKSELAFKDYSAAIANGTKNATVYYKRSLLYSAKSAHRAAVSDLNLSVKIKPKYLEAWYQKGVEHQFLGQITDAIAAYSQAIILDVEFQKAYERRAYLFYVDKNYESSILDNEQLILHFRLRNDTLYIRNAKSKMAILDWSGADRDLMKASGIDPNNEEVLLLRAKVSLAKERVSTAISYLQRATRNNPNSNEAWLMLGEIYYQQKLMDKAIDSLNESIKAEKTGEAYYLRGACYYALKDKTNACLDTQKAAEMGNVQAKNDQAIICR